jgi:ribulose-phosphate 3-epimerase
MVEVSTSILGAKREKIIDTIYDLEKAKTDYFHIDVMDGEFVNDSTNDKMLEFCEYLNSISLVPLDVHLMVKNVKDYVDSYAIFHPNIITFHYEACKNKEEIFDNINYIKQKGCKVGLSIKPETKVEDIYEFLPYIHLVLIMTVKPGKGGQELIESAVKKIKQIKEYEINNKFETDIEADGGINGGNSNQLIEAGVDILVSGSAILNSNDYGEAIKKLKNCK